MSKSIKAVPESLTRKDYISLLSAVGFDPRQLSELRFDADGIYADVYELDENGKHLVVAGGTEAVKNTVFIPVIG